MSVMMPTVVVGCDGSWHSHRAVVAATHEAQRRGAELVVLTVPTLRDLRTDRLRDLATSERDARSNARGMAARGVLWARESDGTVRVRAAIMELGTSELTALLTSTELLVLGGHGSGGQRAFSLGTTSRQLAHTSAAPLFLAGADATSMTPLSARSVVVGLDSQARSGHALAYAAREAALRDTDLVVVCAVLPGGSNAADAVTRAQRDCAAALATLPAHAGKVQVLVSVAPVIEALLGACPDDALLVLGNKGVGGVQGPIPGSLTEKLLEAARCDVLVVPLPASEPVTPAEAVKSRHR